MTTQITNELDVFQLAFVRAYISGFPRNAKRAYQVCRPEIGERTAFLRAAEMMALPAIQAEIERRTEMLREKLMMDQSDVLKDIYTLATADPRELVTVVVGACRYCHGVDHMYHRTLQEYREAVKKYKNSRDGGNDPLLLNFDAEGGIGYNVNADPHPDCPECNGNGLTFEKITPSHLLSPSAAKLCAGVKRTSAGLEIRTRDQDKALAMAASATGLVKSKTELTGKDGGPLVAVSSVTSDPIEAARVYAKLISES